MTFSNVRKLTLSAWLKKNREAEYKKPLKLQKFLFLYETFSKVAGDPKADFGHLKGYKNGPVFSNVWGDYTKDRAEFEIKAENCFNKYGEMINKAIAEQCSFIVSILSESELSALTHEMNIWKTKEKFIDKGIAQIDLDENDFNQNDVRMIETLSNMYPVEMANSSEVLNIDNFYFVIEKNNLSKLTEEHFDILSSLISKEELHNPIFVDIDEDGRLIID